MSQVRIRDIVKYDPRKADFVLADVTVQEFNELIAQAVGRSSNDPRMQRRALIIALQEPINYAIQYISWTEDFFVREEYGPNEDNALPLEDGLQPIAMQTGHLGQITFVEPNFVWTRPEFEQWATGVRFPWKTLERAGWNVARRMMTRASDVLARKIDAAGKVVIDAAIVAAGNTSVDAGGLLLQATVDAVIKAQEAAAQPLTTVKINRGDITDLSNWNAGPLSAGNMPERVAEDLLRNLSFGAYGGMEWVGNSFVPAGSVYMRGLASQIGVHQVRGSMRSDTDTDITRGVDLVAMRTADHAWYIVGAYFLHRITC